ncbi:MAG: asparaginase [Cyanobacteria bacterium P01_H01_bin.121]
MSNINVSKRGHSTALQVQLLREGIPESWHQVQAVVCDPKGRVLMVAGDSESSAFIRSALKPFQALAVTTTGVLQSYNLTDADLAIMCASHQGTVEQARRAFNILWHSDIDPSALQCPTPEGKRSPLQYNCSGKHAGMLATCKLRGWPLTNYTQRKHPVQQLIAAQVAELLGMPPAELLVAQDDCGAPTYFMQLHQMATLYAMLASGDRLELERIVRAMTHHPELVAGEGTFDTEVIRLTAGQVVSKSGAEGIQCLARVGEGLGIAIKVIDGAKRAKYAVATHLLQQLGWVDFTAAETLTEKFLQLGQTKRLDVSGELVLS